MLARQASMHAQASTLPDDHERRLRRWVGIFVLVGLLELPLLMWPWIGPLMQPKRYTNHRDQVAAALQSHGVAVTQVYLEQGWPDQINSQTYGANLIIQLADGANKKVMGRIECREAKRRCWYQVAALGIRREDLSDLVPPAPPEPSRLDRLQETLSRLIG
jgi:hypothetical protein